MRGGLAVIRRVFVSIIVDTPFPPFSCPGETVPPQVGLRTNELKPSHAVIALTRTRVDRRTCRRARHLAVPADCETFRRSADDRDRSQGGRDGPETSESALFLERAARSPDGDRSRAHGGDDLLDRGRCAARS